MASAIKAGREYQEKLDRIQRKKDKARLIAMKPRKYWLAILKREIHWYVRLRDEGKPCISCDTILVLTGKPGGDYDAGHCRSVGSAKHLEFDAERNIHGQCKHCNDHLKGNYHEYCKRLPERIGQENYDALMCDQDDRKYTIEQIQELIAHYRALRKELQHVLLAA